MNQQIKIKQSLSKSNRRRLPAGNPALAVLRWSGVAIPVIMILGCAGAPVVDPVGADMSQYEEHLGECTEIAKGVEQGKIIGSRMAGYVGAGILLGAIFGDFDAARDFGLSGIVQGGVEGIPTAEKEKATVVKNCLERRGYAVLNKES